MTQHTGRRLIEYDMSCVYERAAGGPRRARVPISICFFLIHLTVDQSTALLSVVVIYT